MTKIKRAVSLGVLLLITLLLCLAVFNGKNVKATKEVDNSVNYDEVSEYGIYTNLSLALDGGYGQVWATVKNKFTLFSSAVAVKVELYNAATYQDSYSDMTLVASNYISDLNQGKSISAVAETNGKTSYWKARMYYKIDNDGWKDRVTNTVLLDKNGLKTDVFENDSNSKEVGEYFIADFLQKDTEFAYISIYPYIFEYDIDPDVYGFAGYVGNADIWLESESEMTIVKDLFGEIKLNTFDLETKTYEEQQFFYLSESCADFDIHLKFSDGSNTKIYIKDYEKNISDSNLFVQYNYYTENGDKIHRCFTASICNEAIEALVNFAINIFESR